MKFYGRSILKVAGINFCVFLFLVLMVEFFSFILLASLPRLSNFLHHSKNKISIEADARINSPAYTNKEYARKIYREFASVKVQYDPNFVWSLVPNKNTTLNIDEAGHRLTCYLPQYQRSEHVIQIFMFGGSTLFGTGSDDCNTIPSLLAKKLNILLSSRAFQITNFGATGHESTQELSHLIAELRKGARPDIVIFYDGVNDSYASAYSPGIAGAHENLDSISKRFESSSWSVIWKNSSTMKLISYLVERTRRTAKNAEVGDLELKTKKAIATYKTNIEILDSLSQRYGFKYIAFWQPVLLASRKTLTFYENSCKKTSGVLNQVFQSVYSQLRAEKNNFNLLTFYDLSDVFDRNEGEMFVDYCHTSPEGNEIIAQAMKEKIIPLLSKQMITQNNKNNLG